MKIHFTRFADFQIQVYIFAIVLAHGLIHLNKSRIHALSTEEKI